MEASSLVAPDRADESGLRGQWEWEWEWEEVRAKDEQISLLKASLTKLNQGLLEKDGRIAELEAHCQALTNQLAVTVEIGTHHTAATEVQNGKENGLKGEKRSTVQTVASTKTAGADQGAELNGNSEERGGDLNGGSDDKEQTSNGCRKNGVAGASNGSSHAGSTNRGTTATGGKIWRPRSYQTLLEQMSPRRLSTIHEREDAACRCSCSQRVQELRAKMGRLEAAVQEREDVIASLKADNKRKGSELLEVQQQKLQRAISEKDSAIAVLELQSDPDSKVERLRLERTGLMQDLKDKAEQRLKLLRRDSVVSLEEGLGSLALRYQNCDREQVCEVLRILALDSARMRAYIDELLALVLERNPALLEGLPRIQLRGTRPELLTAASLPELLEELCESEANDRCLQEYAGLLLQRIEESEPDILESVSQFQTNA